ncbi:MAG: quinoprotein dehydrogenase-associated putative ABC transporter substrate-binding protein [Rhodanobacteraceae bacterium]
MTTTRKADGLERQPLSVWRSKRMVLLASLLALLAPAIVFAQGGDSQAPHPASSKVLRVCVDPGDMPFSDQARQGFEDKLAVMAADALGARAEFDWHRGAGLMRALRARQCDVVMGWPTLDKTAAVVTTRPYYRSTYVLVYRQSSPYRIHSLKDPVLKKLRIGVRTIGDEWTGLPGGAMLAAHGLQDSAHPYPLRGNTSTVSPSLDLIKAVADGDVDAAIAWGPPAGYFARRESVKLAVVPLTRVHLKLPTRFSISMAVRADDVALREKLDRFLDRHRKTIRALLAGYDVPLLPLENASNNSSVAEQ